MAVRCFNENLSGTPVVLIHGILLSNSFWTENAPVSVRARRWYSLGLPGHYPCLAPHTFLARPLGAQTFEQTIGAALSSLLGDEAAVLIGHSTGGFAALNLAAARHRNVKSVVSVSGFVQGRCQGLVGLLQREAGLGAAGRLGFKLGFDILTRNPALMAFVFRQTAADKRALNDWSRRESTLQALMPDLQHADAYALAHVLEAIGRIDITPRLSHIECPVLAIHGRADPTVPHEQAERVAQKVVDARLESMSGVGHLPFAERPQEYEELIAQWLTQHGN